MSSTEYDKRLEILLRLHYSDRPLFYLSFKNESVETEKELACSLNHLIEIGFIERPKILHTQKSSPFFKLTNSGKKFVEEIVGD